jgi:hypothetical protein
MFAYLSEFIGDFAGVGGVAYCAVSPCCHHVHAHVNASRHVRDPSDRLAAGQNR